MNKIVLICLICFLVIGVGRFFLRRNKFYNEYLKRHINMIEAEKNKQFYKLDQKLQEELERKGLK